MIIRRSVSPLLALLVNQSFQSRIFPDKLKIAKVIALFKKGNPELPSNYMSISLLHVFSKIISNIFQTAGDLARSANDLNQLLDKERDLIVVF